MCLPARRGGEYGTPPPPPALFRTAMVGSPRLFIVFAGQDAVTPTLYACAR